MIVKQVNDFHILPLDMCSSFRVSLLKSCIKLTIELNFIITKIKFTTSAGHTDYYYHVTGKPLLFELAK